MKKGHLASFYDIQVAKENMKKMRSDQFGPYGKLNPTSMTIKTKSGEEIPVTLSASLITIDGKEVGSVGVFTDMREILKIRKELEDANIQLIQSQKIASIGRMAAGVAHEINNPLSGILIYTELLKETPQGQAGVSERSSRDHRPDPALQDDCLRASGIQQKVRGQDLLLQSGRPDQQVPRPADQQGELSGHCGHHEHGHEHAQPDRRHEPASAGVHEPLYQCRRCHGRKRKAPYPCNALTRIVLFLSSGWRTRAREFLRSAGTRSLIFSLRQNRREKAPAWG